MLAKLIVGINDLETVNPELAKQWDYKKNGDLKPRNVCANSNKKVWWLCNKEHSFKSKISIEISKIKAVLIVLIKKFLLVIMIFLVNIQTY